MASDSDGTSELTLELNRIKKQDLIDILVNKTVTSNVNQNDTLKKFFENLFKINTLNNESNLNACLEVKHMKKEISNLEKLNGHLEERIKDQTLIINLLTNKENYNIRNNGNLENCKQFTNTLSYAGVLSHDSKQEVKQSQFLNLNTTGSSKLCKETVTNHVTPINEANYKSTSTNTKSHKFLSNSIGYPSTSTTVVNNNEKDSEIPIAGLNNNQRRKRNFIFGTATGDQTERLQAYIPKSTIHISKLTLENTKDDLINYIKNQIPSIDIECEELIVRSKSYRSFKVSVPYNYKQALLTSDFWPNYIAVKPFFLL
ncbi:hypothetical protein RN001_008995 [Aquatica leii]|uniref:Uncharacterized protein n=1 Tax=Aquatica leii TaxID=1421715 RepID=A0AAN7PY06_9COLE|nr:hypothetical protein RN001_008995 [Aquatica leii]